MVDVKAAMGISWLEMTRRPSVWLAASRRSWSATAIREPIWSSTFVLLDKDGDGVLTKEEWDAGWDLFDLDKDGFITKDDFHVVAGPRSLVDCLDVASILRLWV